LAEDALEEERRWREAERQRARERHNANQQEVQSLHEQLLAEQWRRMAAAGVQAAEAPAVAAGGRRSSGEPRA